MKKQDQDLKNDEVNSLVAQTANLNSNKQSFAAPKKQDNADNSKLEKEQLSKFDPNPLDESNDLKEKTESAAQMNTLLLKENQNITQERDAARRAKDFLQEGHDKIFKELLAEKEAHTKTNQALTKEQTEHEATKKALKKTTNVAFLKEYDAISTTRKKNAVFGGVEFMVAGLVVGGAIAVKELSDNFQNLPFSIDGMGPDEMKYAISSIAAVVILLSLIGGVHNLYNRHQEGKKELSYIPADATGPSTMPYSEVEKPLVASLRQEQLVK